MIGWTLTAQAPDGNDRTVQVQVLEDGAVDVRIAGTNRAWAIEDVNELGYVWGEVLKELARRSEDEIDD